MTGRDEAKLLGDLKELINAHLIVEEAADELFRMFTADVERRRLSAVGLYRY